MTGATEVSRVNMLFEVQARIQRIRLASRENTARAMRVKDQTSLAGPPPGTGAAGALNLLA